MLLARPHALAVQAHAPRRQRFGTMNVDGFGAGWYVPGRVEPVRYRRAVPIWSDASFASLAPTVAAGCVLGAVRSATPGFSADESACAPFGHGRYLLSHNGRVDGLPGLRGDLGARVADTPDAHAGVDSAVVHGLAARRWDAGATLGEGLAGAVADVRAVAADPGAARLALLATDGVGLAGTTCGDELWWCERDGGVVLASEPDDDEPGWQQVPDEHVVTVDAAGVTSEALSRSDRSDRPLHIEEHA